MAIETILEKAQEIIALYGLNLLAALVIFVVGRWVAKSLVSVLKKAMTKRAVEPTLISFVSSLTYIALLCFVVIAALSKLGVQTASFVAVLGAAGLAVALALQGSLSNFAAGVLMIIFKPFKVGDYIEGGGATGIVEEISIFTTQLVTPDNKAIIIPNAKIAGDNIVNYHKKDTRRCDLVFGVSYSDDLDKVRRIIKEVLATCDHILETPAPKIAVSELADSSVNFIVRPWVKNEHYWEVFFYLTEEMKKRFDQEGVSIPFPQRDVHLFEEVARADVA